MVLGESTLMDLRFLNINLVWGFHTMKVLYHNAFYIKMHHKYEMRPTMKYNT